MFMPCIKQGLAQGFSLIEYIQPMKNLKQYLLVFIISAALGFVGKNYLASALYEATAILFPSNTHSADHLLDAGLRFGDEKESGEYIELLNSNAVLSKIVKEFNLKKHYKISNADTSQNAVIDFFKTRFEVNRSPNRSLHLTLRDKDPEIAAKLSLRLVEIADEHLSALVKGMLNRDFEAVNALVAAKERDVLNLIDSLDVLERNGAVQLKGANIWKTTQYRMVESLYSSEVAELVNLRSDAQKIKSALARNVPSAYMVSNAVPPVKPVGLTSGITGLLCGIFSIAVLFVIRNRQKFKF
jgi:hypothetical protein